VKLRRHQQLQTSQTNQQKWIAHIFPSECQLVFIKQIETKTKTSSKNPVEPRMVSDERVERERKKKRRRAFVCVCVKMMKILSREKISRTCRKEFKGHCLGNSCACCFGIFASMMGFIERQ
jgi:hypothetical protein